MILKAKGVPIIITAGSNYLDIDAYACCIAMQELLELQGINSVAYSTAPCNYSVCKSLVLEGQLKKVLPPAFLTETVAYLIVDVSDPNFIRDTVPLERVEAVFDHHAGFETYWEERIGEDAHIEFLGAAATLIFREWKASGLLERRTRSTALLLIAAILDNTLNLTSSNTTQEDRKAFSVLCKKENIDTAWCAAYFSEVQDCVEADLEAALMKDVKTVRESKVLPKHVAQLAVWEAGHILERINTVRQWFDRRWDSWMINLIDISCRCSYFVCDDPQRQRELERIFDVHFAQGVAWSSVSFLRKEILKKVQEYEDNA